MYTFCTIYYRRLSEPDRKEKEKEKRKNKNPSLRLTRIDQALANTRRYEAFIIQCGSDLSLHNYFLLANVHNCCCCYCCCINAHAVGILIEKKSTFKIKNFHTFINKIIPN